MEDIYHFTNDSLGGYILTRLKFNQQFMEPSRGSNYQSLGEAAKKLFF